MEKAARSREKSLRAFKGREQHVWIRNSRNNRDRLLDSLAGTKGMTTDGSIGAHSCQFLERSVKVDSGGDWSVSRVKSNLRRLRMKLKIAMAVVALFVFASTAGLATAQDTTKTTHKKTRTLTGCLQKGDDANEYKLTTTKGATWEIKSDTVKLEDHVAHTVTITGVVSNATLHGAKEDAKAEAKEHGIDKDSTEHGHMTVTDLKMVSDSCSK